MNAMQWTIYALSLIGLIGFMIMRRSGQVPKKAAADYIRNGAYVVDVRTSREFSAGHLLQAFNFPLEELEGTLPQRIKDKNRVILVHCRTGLRSKQAKERLESIGYKHVFDLGSYERAFRIVSGRML